MASDMAQARDSGPAETGPDPDPGSVAADGPDRGRDRAAAADGSEDGRQFTIANSKLGMRASEFLILHCQFLIGLLR